MGRVRGKGKKQSISSGDYTVSGDDEKIPTRRRGRPQKPLKDETEEDEKADKLEEEKDEDDDEKTLTSVLSKTSKNQASQESGRKRKRSSQIKDHADENGVGMNTNTTDSIKNVGFRQNGSRRKNKPRRAAEVGVECK